MIKLKFSYTNGDIGYLGPIACDNPKSLFGYNDNSIKRKREKWCKDLSGKDVIVTIEVS